MRELETASRLGDEELIVQLKRWVREDHEVTVRLLVHIGELDERRLFRDAGYSSMFDYAVRALSMSEAQAALRIRAARVVRKYPEALDMLGRGELHLTALCILAPVLSHDCRELLGLARHKSKLELHELVARYFPKPDVRNEVRRLPAAANANPAVSAIGSSASGPLLTACESNPGAIAVDSSVESQRSISHSNTLGLSAEHAQPPRMHTTLPLAPSAIAQETSRFEPAGERTQINTLNVQAPLSEHRYKIQFTASRRMNEKLEQAKTLLRHQIPTGDLEAVFERALDLLIADRRKKMFGLTEKPRSVSSKAVAPTSSQTEGTSTSIPAKRPQSRYVPRKFRRQVHARDGGRCCFVARNGKRCESRDRIEFHHIAPFARGGEMALENIELRCRAHNALAAERDFGRDKVRQKIQSRQASKLHQRAKQTSASTAQRSAPLPNNQLTVQRRGELRHVEPEDETKRGHVTSVEQSAPVIRLPDTVQPEPLLTAS
jgi:hypothetical protein